MENEYTYEAIAAQIEREYSRESGPMESIIIVTVRRSDGVERDVWVSAGIPESAQASARNAGAFFGLGFDGWMRVQAFGGSLSEWCPDEFRDDHEAVLEACEEIALDTHKAEILHLSQIPQAEPIIEAIQDGLRAGADESDWWAEEFEAARELTKDAGCEWDFDGWESTLSCVRQGQLGGVTFRFASSVTQ